MEAKDLFAKRHFYHFGMQKQDQSFLTVSKDSPVESATALTIRKVPSRTRRWGMRRAFRAQIIKHFVLPGRQVRGQLVIITHIKSRKKLVELGGLQLKNIKILPNSTKQGRRHSWNSFFHLDGLVLPVTPIHQGNETGDHVLFLFTFAARRGYEFITPDSNRLLLLFGLNDLSWLFSGFDSFWVVLQNVVNKNE